MVKPLLKLSLMDKKTYLKFAFTAFWVGLIFGVIIFLVCVRM